MPRSRPEDDDVDPRIRHIRYECSKCHAPTARDDLTVKRASFVTMGFPYKNIRQRSIAWLCPSCRDADPEWNLPARASAPGMADTKLAE